MNDNMTATDNLAHRCNDYVRDMAVWCEGDEDNCQTCKFFTSVIDKCMIGR